MEKTFEYSTRTYGGNRPAFNCGVDIGMWLETVSQSARVTVRVEPLPERVKWPWVDDLKRVRVGPAVPANNVSSGFGRTISLLSIDRSYLCTVDMFALGTWPANESRIASNDNGFVKLSEVPDAK